MFQDLDNEGILPVKALTQVVQDIAVFIFDLGKFK